MSDLIPSFTTTQDGASLPATNTFTAAHHPTPQLQTRQNAVVDPLAGRPELEENKHIGDDVSASFYPVTGLTTSTNTTTSSAAAAARNATAIAQPLSKQEQKSMMESIVAVFNLEETQDQEMRDEGDEEEVEVDLEDQRRRTERLVIALNVVEKLWWASSEHVEAVTEKLADGSRDRKFFLFTAPAEGLSISSSYQMASVMGLR